MVRGHIGTFQNGSGVTRERLKCLRGSLGASDTAWGASAASKTTLGRFGSVRNGPVVLKTARGCLSSACNSPGAPRECPKRPWGTSGVSETARVASGALGTARGALGASKTALRHLGSIQNGLGVTRERLKWPKGASGASATAWECLWSVRNGPRTPQERPQRPVVDSGASEMGKGVPQWCSKPLGGASGMYETASRRLGNV